MRYFSFVAVSSRWFSRGEISERDCTIFPERFFFPLLDEGMGMNGGLRFRHSSQKGVYRISDDCRRVLPHTEGGQHDGIAKVAQRLQRILDSHVPFFACSTYH